MLRCNNKGRQIVQEGDSDNDTDENDDNDSLDDDNDIDNDDGYDMNNDNLDVGCYDQRNALEQSFNSDKDSREEEVESIDGDISAADSTVLSILNSVTNSLKKLKFPQEREVPGSNENCEITLRLFVNEPDSVAKNVIMNCTHCNKYCTTSFDKILHEPFCVENPSRKGTTKGESCQYLCVLFVTVNVRVLFLENSYNFEYSSLIVKKSDSLYDFLLFREINCMLCMDTYRKEICPKEIKASKSFRLFDPTKSTFY